MKYSVLLAALLALGLTACGQKEEAAAPATEAAAPAPVAEPAAAPASPGTGRVSQAGPPARGGAGST